MNLDLHDIYWICGLLLMAGIAVNKPSKRFGVPGLVLYLTIGILVGNGGKYDFVYDYPEATLRYSEFALAMIIFIGGLNTDVARFRHVALEGSSLATIGVLVSSAMMGLIGYLLLDLDWAEAWLLGAVISATDSAAVFSILQNTGIRLNHYIAETLEFESGTNDPMAYFLTIALTTWITTSDATWYGIIGQFFLSVILGFVLGYLIGRIALLLSEHLNLDVIGLYPLILLSAALIVIGTSGYAQANMLLSMYVCGITMGNGHLPHRSYSVNFFDSISWLMEITLFLILGLQVFPRDMLSTWPIALLLAFFLMFVARPASVFAALKPFKASKNKKIFISWVGLRGATPIVFSLVPLVAKVRHSELIFNTVFFVVIVSVLVQGTTLTWLAKKLKLVSH